MRSLHLQVWLGVADLPNAMPFAVMYGLQGVARALPLTILPLTALEIMGSAQEVNLLYFCASFVGLAGSLSMPLLVHLIRRRRVVALGAVLICLAAALLSLGSGIVFAAGLTCFLVRFIAIDISFNLHLMYHIPRQEFGHFEPVRVLFMGSGFIIGPMAGVWLSQAFERPAPFIAMAVVTLIVYAVFLYLRFSDNKAIQAAKTSPPNPLKFFPHFFQQSRLRLAWLLAVGRSGWWAMFFVYGPIYCVQSGLGETVAGLLVSAGSGAVMLCPFWGWVGRRWGIRKLLMIGYAASAVATIAVAVVSGSPWVGITFFLIAAFVISMIDGASNMLFLRAVHPHERTEMTSAFVTFRDTSQIGPPGVFSALLKVFALPAVLVAAGVGMVAMAWYSR